MSPSPAFSVNSQGLIVPSDQYLTLATPFDDTGSSGFLPAGGGTGTTNTGGGGTSSGGTVLSGNPVTTAGQVIGVLAGSSVATTVGTSILGYIFTSRFVLFIIGIICIIAGLYLLKPGPVTTIITAPIKAAKKGIQVGAEAATAA